MSLEGRLEWTGDDPSVVKLTDNGVRKVQIRLESLQIGAGRVDRFQLEVVIADPDRFLSELAEARVWANGEGR